VGIVVRFLVKCSCRSELLFCSHLFNAAHMSQQKVNSFSNSSGVAPRN
jgi:hypothetical protein